MLKRVLLTCAALLLVPASANGQAAHLCTGIGLDAREEAAVFPHTLKLVYAAPTGNYIADVAVRISRGETIVFEGTCDGPWLMLNLDPGTYTVVSTFEGQTKTGTVRVGTRPSQHAIVFQNVQ